MSNSSCWGLIARFGTAGELLDAVRRTRGRYRYVEAYSPFPVDGMEEALGLRRDGVRWFALVGGVFGMLSALFVQYSSAVFAYPLNVGGRPAASWPAFVPITFIATLAWIGIGAFVGMLILNRLPRLYHPVFNAAGIAEATRSGFFLVVRAADPAFDDHRTRAFLAGLNPAAIEEVQA